MVERPKVAVVYRLDHPGGVQSVALSLIRGLNARGIIPDVLWDLPPSQNLLEKSNCRAGYQSLKFRVPSLWIDRLPDTLRYLAWIFNVIDERKSKPKYDFYFVLFNNFLPPDNNPHLRYLNGPPLLPQLENISTGPHGWPIRFFRWSYQSFLYRWLPAYEYHRNSQYVANSMYISQLFEEAYGINLPVVYPPIQMDGRTFSLADLDQRDTITFFSRIVPYKRPDMVLELAARNRDYRCVIMGGVPAHRMPYFEYLKGKATELGLNNVNFLANPCEELVRTELARTRFYIFPAVNEHFGMTTVEAAASGAIPFVHNSGGQREIVNVDALRFRDDIFFERFTELKSKSFQELNELRVSLGAHIRQFAEDVSVRKLLAYMDLKPDQIDNPEVIEKTWSLS